VVSSNDALNGLPYKLRKDHDLLALNPAFNLFGIVRDEFNIFHRRPYLGTDL
jgi:hypothetical protein